MTKTNADRAAAIVSDGRAYLGKKQTANLVAFQEFVTVVAGPSLREAGLSEADAATVLELSTRIAGLYSRYGKAKLAGLLDEVQATATPAPKPVRKPRAPKSTPAKA